MATWSAVEKEIPELAELARSFLDAHIHKTLATLRRDGSPRISGTEATFSPDGLWFGSMPGAMKARDLQRDPRLSLHSGSVDPPDWKGDAKVSGHALEVTDAERKAAITGSHIPPDPFHLFLVDVTELVVVRLAESGDRLVIESWHEGRGHNRRERG